MTKHITLHHSVYNYCFTEANSSITGPSDERATVFPRIVLPTTSIDLVETSFNDDDYPTEVLYYTPYMSGVAE